MFVHEFLLYLSNMRNNRVYKLNILLYLHIDNEICNVYYPLY